MKAITLDRAAGTAIAALLVLSGLVVFAGTRVGIRVQAEFADEVGPYGPLTLHFSTPVDAARLEESVRFEPEANGRFEWPDDRTMRFVPDEPFAPEAQYELTLMPGTPGVNGEALRDQHTWPFSIREPQIVFLTFVDQKSQLVTTDLQGAAPRPLFDIDNIVFEFDVSRDGELIIFSVFNGQTGLDLWRVSRDGSDPHVVLDCGAGRCSTPAVSPDGGSVAYTRESPGLAPGQAPGAPRVWLLDLATGADRPLFADSQILGYGPAWSPDGKWLSSYDGLQDALRVVSLETGEQHVLESVFGDDLTWSQDSTRLLFTDVEITEQGLRTVVDAADFATGEIANLIGAEDERDYGYGALAWSPVDERLILGLRPDPDRPAQGLWLVDPDILAGPMIAGVEGMNYDRPHWDAWGGAVLFQQFELGAAYRPEIAWWMPGFTEPRVIAEGLSARWLP